MQWPFYADFERCNGVNGLLALHRCTQKSNVLSEHMAQSILLFNMGCLECREESATCVADIGHSFPLSIGFEENLNRTHVIRADAKDCPKSTEDLPS